MSENETFEYDQSPLWLVAYPDGREPRVIRAVSKEGAIKGRFRDEDDPIRYGVVAVWRLGQFPSQFEVTEDQTEASGVRLRDMGNPRVR